MSGNVNKNWTNENAWPLDPISLKALLDSNYSQEVIVAFAKALIEGHEGPEAFLAAMNYSELSKTPRGLFGNDNTTREVSKQFKQMTNQTCKVIFSMVGTGANGLALSYLTTERHKKIIVVKGSHVEANEYNTQATFTNGVGMTVITPDKDGKLTVEAIEEHLEYLGDNLTEHSCISVTNPTDVGTVYTPEELKQLAEYAKSKKWKMHIDCARLPNALAYLNCSLADLTCDTGADVVTISGTKAGGMTSEVILLFNDPRSMKELKAIQKNSGQEYSKERDIAAQFEGLMKDDFWIKKAKIANDNALILADALKRELGMEPAYKVQTNAVFFNRIITIRNKTVNLEQILKDNGQQIYTWPGQLPRFITSSYMQPEHVETLIKDIEKGLRMTG